MFSDGTRDLGVFLRPKPWRGIRGSVPCLRPHDTVDCVDVAFEIAKLASLARRPPPSLLSWPLALPRANLQRPLEGPGKGQRLVRDVLLFGPAAVPRLGGRRCSRQQAGKACESSFQLSDERLGFGIPRKGLESRTHVAL